MRRFMKLILEYAFTHYFTIEELHVLDMAIMHKTIRMIIECFTDEIVFYLTRFRASIT